LLEAIVKPSKAIAAGFVGQLIMTFDGVVHSGIVVSETEDQITLRNAQGTDVVLDVEEIDIRKALEKSAMPEDIIKDVPADELQSLLDYLKSIAVEPAPGEPIPGAPAAAAPVTGAPVTGAPVTGAPVTGAPATGAPTSGEPTSGEPASGGEAIKGASGQNDNQDKNNAE
jgi:hypothetical protein